MRTILFLRKQVVVFKAKTAGRVFTLLIACASGMLSHSQQKKTPTKSPVQLADQYFAAGEYYTAANLYEQYLNPSKKQQTVSEFPLNIKARRTSSTTPNISR